MNHPLLSFWLKLKELKNLQQQYLQINQEITELRPVKAQLQEYQDKTKTFQIMQEELRQENLSWQHELHQLRYDNPCFCTLLVFLFFKTFYYEIIIAIYRKLQK